MAHSPISEQLCWASACSPPVIVFVFRYLDLFWNFLSIYNWIMKLIFIASSVGIVSIIRFGKPHKVGAALAPLRNRSLVLAARLCRIPTTRTTTPSPTCTSSYQRRSLASPSTCSCWLMVRSTVLVACLVRHLGPTYRPRADPCSNQNLIMTTTHS